MTKLIKIGKTHISGYEAYEMPPEYRDLMGNRVETRVYIDCYGDYMIAENVGLTSSFLARDSGVAPWAYPKFACAVGLSGRSPQGMFIDTRYLDLILSGCCPPQITSEILEAAGD